MTTSELPSTPLNAIVRPPEAVTEPVQVARVLWLRSLFGEAAAGEDDSRPLDVLAARMTEYFVPRGTPLYQQGSSSNALYFILEGTIEQGVTGYTRYVAGDVLGFIDAMVGRPHARTAMVLEDALVLRLKMDDWFEYLDEHFTTLHQLVLRSLRNVDCRPDSLTPDAKEICNDLCSDSTASPTGEFVKRLLAARLNPLFRMASIQSIAQLVRRAKSIRLVAGESWENSTLLPGIYLIVGGELTLVDPLSPDSPPISFALSSGQLIGSIRSLLPFPGPTTIRTKSGAQVLHIETEVFFDVMEDHFDLARSTLSYLAARVEDFNAQKPAEHGN